MSKNKISRRDFFKKTIFSGIAFAGLLNYYSCSKSSDTIELLGEPTAILGKTGVRIPRISVGTGSRFCSIIDEEEALEVLTYALDNGLFSWDTAYSYGNNEDVISEERIGKILKDRRGEVFLTSKATARDPDIAMRQIETSLKRLQTDYFDNLMIHHVGSMEDVERVSKKEGVIDLFEKLKSEGITRFIGFSGHGDSHPMNAIMDRADFDTMLIAMDQHSADSQREDLLIPKAKEKNIGVLLMKVVRPKETVSGVNAEELIRYALTIDGPAGIVLGMDSMEVVKSNVDILNSYKPMNSEEQARVASALETAILKKEFEWKKEGYIDGVNYQE